MLTSIFPPCDKYEWDVKQQQFLVWMLTSRNLFLTGGAGTGKSRLLKYMIKSMRQNGCVLKSKLSAYSQNTLLNLENDLEDVMEFAGHDQIEAETFCNAIRHDQDEGWLAVTATTGNAATIIHGMTLHSFAGIGLNGESWKEYVKYFHVMDSHSQSRANRQQGVPLYTTKKGQKKPTWDHVTKLMANRQQKKISPHYKWAKERIKWRRLGCLIIDEVSMLEPLFLGHLDQCMRRIREIDKPFGGVQMIMCGDFFQLPPVNKREPTTTTTNSFFKYKHYRNNHTSSMSISSSQIQPLTYAFEHQAWMDAHMVNVVLTKIYRQSGDTIYIELLNRARTGDVSAEDEMLLNGQTLANIERRERRQLDHHNDASSKPTQRYPSTIIASPSLTEAEFGKSIHQDDHVDENELNNHHDPNQHPSATILEHQQQQQQQHDFDAIDKDNKMTIEPTRLFYQRDDVRIANEEALLRLNNKIVTFRGSYIIGPFTKNNIITDFIYDLRNYTDDWTQKTTVAYKSTNNDKMITTQLSSGMLSILAKSPLVDLLQHATPTLVDDCLKTMGYADWKSYRKRIPLEKLEAMARKCLATQYDTTLGFDVKLGTNNPLLPPLSIYKNPMIAYNLESADGKHNVVEDNPIHLQRLSSEEKLNRLKLEEQFDWPSVYIHHALQFSPDFFTLLCDTRHLPHPPYINLSLGSQVKLTKNLDVDKGLVNGSRGVVIGFQPIHTHAENNHVYEQLWPCVKFEIPSDDKKKYIRRVIIPHVYEVASINKRMRIMYPPSYRQTQSKKIATSGYVTKTRVFYQQIPLELANCCTYHGSQGTTLQGQAIMDLSKPYPAGLGYTGLSRVPRLSDLRLQSTFNRESVRADPLVIAFYQKMTEESLPS